MDEKEFLREKEKLNQVVQQLLDEEKELEEHVAKNDYDNNSYVSSHLAYLNNKKLSDLKKIKKKPYFARIDFKSKNDPKEELYIGKLSILDSETQKPIIIDWRAPISNLYYDGRIGNSSYKSPEGIIEGTIFLKRQYFIENQILEKYSDIDLKTNDELLQIALNEKADDRLKNIVATIQGEQNDIIRADMNTALIVQGVAGSGKTTIALHRIAYLIYNCDKEFDPENFMIIAPNKFFLNYISNVLPDLGVENVKQYTFEDFGESEDLSVFAVFDGMGGIDCGETASLLASEKLCDYFVEAAVNWEVFSGKEAIYEINKSLCKEMEKRSMTMGSTAVLLTFQEGEACIANVGDSRAYLYRAESLRQISVDHTEQNSLLELQKELGLTESIAMPGMKDMLTQHLGISEEEFLLEPFVSEKIKIQPEDTFLLCSDGLSGALSDEILQEFLERKEEETIKERAFLLLQKALQVGGKDNITFVLVEF